MSFASEKLYNGYLRTNMPTIVSTVKVREMVVHLPCLTAHDRETIEARRAKCSNSDGMVLLLDCLKRRENWPEHFINALEMCEHTRIAAEVRAEYNALRGAHDSNPSSPSPAAKTTNVHPAPDAPHLLVLETSAGHRRAAATPPPVTEAQPKASVPAPGPESPDRVRLRENAKPETLDPARPGPEETSQSEFLDVSHLDQVSPGEVSAVPTEQSDMVSDMTPEQNTDCNPSFPSTKEEAKVHPAPDEPHLPLPETKHRACLQESAEPEETSPSDFLDVSHPGQVSPGEVSAVPTEQSDVVSDVTPEQNTDSNPSFPSPVPPASDEPHLPVPETSAGNSQAAAAPPTPPQPASNATPPTETEASAPAPAPAPAPATNSPPSPDRACLQENAEPEETSPFDFLDVSNPDQVSPGEVSAVPTEQNDVVSNVTPEQNTDSNPSSPSPAAEATNVHLAPDEPHLPVPETRHRACLQESAEPEETSPSDFLDVSHPDQVSPGEVSAVPTEQSDVVSDVTPEQNTDSNPSSPSPAAEAANVHPAPDEPQLPVPETSAGHSQASAAALSHLQPDPNATPSPETKAQPEASAPAPAPMSPPSPDRVCLQESAELEETSPSDFVDVSHPNQVSPGEVSAVPTEQSDVVSDVTLEQNTDYNPSSPSPDAEAANVHPTPDEPQPPVPETSAGHSQASAAALSPPQPDPNATPSPETKAQPEASAPAPAPALPPSPDRACLQESAEPEETSPSGFVDVSHPNQVSPGEVSAVPTEQSDVVSDVTPGRPPGETTDPPVEEVAAVTLEPEENSLVCSVPDASQTESTSVSSALLADDLTVGLSLPCPLLSAQPPTTYSGNTDRLEFSDFAEGETSAGPEENPPEEEEVRVQVMHVTQQPSLLDLDGQSVSNGDASKREEPANPSSGRLTANSKYILTALGVGAGALLMAWKWKH
ncbi:cell surface glycoprotein 1-like [Nerophis ophidion]|uniref:cell surface glycoprotein 1-like n=1 Tax=Nerophis ophidion TaxID=159077 RepID=UPI002AE0128C|nr:cell surface glycoprotein 1-like [Nerophis ophidion]XP_061741721.1 cell surface glycoprotein 1-like [Nerophis ophidion]XP_061741723.1 cell surface glycoprotein 1-like [Nerophis ophidion]